MPGITASMADEAEPEAESPDRPKTLQAFRQVPRTGVIYVTHEANVRGFWSGHEDWCNLGQGQPESVELPAAPPRRGAIIIDPGDHEYAPVPGLWEAVSSAGSYLDGGGSKPLQRAAVELVTEEHARAETEAIRASFLPKRELVLRRARELGMHVDREPEGTFYAFVSLDDLPPPIADGMAFFRAALERRVITVPGIFFDVNPGGRRAQRLSRFRQHLRLSFGPPIEEVRRGLDRLEAMIREAADR